MPIHLLVTLLSFFLFVSFPLPSLFLFHAAFVCRFNSFFPPSFFLFFFFNFSLCSLPSGRPSRQLPLHFFRIYLPILNSARTSLLKIVCRTLLTLLNTKKKIVNRKNLRQWNSSSSSGQHKTFLFLAFFLARGENTK